MLQACALLVLGYDAPAASQGYAAPTESYAAPAAEVHSYTHSHSICYEGCAVETPCYDAGSGACVAAIRGPIATTLSAQYGGEISQQGGYRKLSDATCPEGTVDSTHFSLSNSIILWVALVFLFIPGLWFICQGFADVQKSISGPNGTIFQRLENIQLTRVIVGVVCLIASIAYLTMATGHGYVTRCDGRDFYYARYIDWAITTPLMLFDICKITGQNSTTIFFIIAMDFCMIIAGLIGGLISSSGTGLVGEEPHYVGDEHYQRALQEAGGSSGSEKWAFFGISVLSFVPVLFFLCSFTAGPICSPTTVSGANKAERLAMRVINLTVISWFFYPLVWIAAEGTGILSANGEAVCYTVLDVISKSLFGFIFVCTEYGTARTLFAKFPDPADPRSGEYQITDTMSPAGAGVDITPAPVWEQVSGTGLITWLGSAWAFDIAINNGAERYFNTSTAIDPPTTGWFLSGSPPPTNGGGAIITYDVPRGFN